MSEWSLSRSQKTIDKFRNPFKFWLFKFTQLPAAWFMGLRMTSLEAKKCTISIKHGWRNKNPYQSMYFAAQCAAGELATGALAIVISKGFAENILMLVVSVEAEFTKKAVGNIAFTCTEGEAMLGVIQNAIVSDASRVFRATAIGTDEKGDVVSRIYVSWSFKYKK